MEEIEIVRLLRAIKESMVDGGLPIVGDEEVVRFTRSRELEGAAKRFGEIEVAKTIPLDFEIDKAVELKVNLGIAPNAMLRQGGQHEKQFVFDGKFPDTDVTKSGIVTIEGITGHFSKWVTKGDALDWLKAHPERDLHTWFAAWCREAFLEVIRYYDGGDEIAFVDEGESIWVNTLEEKQDRNPYYPGLWHDQGCTGARSMNHAKQGWRVGKRFFFIRGKLNF